MEKIVDKILSVVKEELLRKNEEYTREGEYPFQNILDRAAMLGTTRERIIASDLLKKTLSIVQRRTSESNLLLRVYIKIINYGIIGIAVLLEREQVTLEEALEIHGNHKNTT